MISVNDELFPGCTEVLELEEERRLFYVGITRASDHLIMTFQHPSLKLNNYLKLVENSFLKYLTRFITFIPNFDDLIDFKIFD